MPFSLAYISEAMILVETTIPTARYQFVPKEPNNRLLEHKLDLLDEKRELAFIRIAAYKQKVKNITTKTSGPEPSKRTREYYTKYSKK